MPAKGMQSSESPRAAKYPLLSTILSGLCFVVLLVLLIVVGNNFDNLEKQLSFRPQGVVSHQVSGVYGIEIVEGQTVYVPIYSHIYADGGKPYLLEATLSIRNLDPEQSISIKSVNYFDTSGKMISVYLQEPRALGPLETTEFLVEKRDTRGGSGANFIVIWDAEKPVYQPIIEAVMVGFSDNRSISFTSPGRELVKIKP